MVALHAFGSNGRFYRTKSSAELDWVGGRDFVHRGTGAYFTVKDSKQLVKAGYGEVMVFTAEGFVHLKITGAVQ